MEDISVKVDRCESSALTALQEAAEAYIIELFRDSARCMEHAERDLLMPVGIANNSCLVMADMLIG